MEALRRTGGRTGTTALPPWTDDAPVQEDNEWKIARGEQHGT
ncbi:hypothetical protein C7S16_5377 [Burkholderia thailandensis]|uniref:Uncharacterized protein n=1 Tax=Burkholderia thailandensis TaxID=57975 RepID=A0AAW9CK97_BURTH|nr:hypothetical protein [Burkholderia thailandensis]MCS6472375.1 hypothetical protein [Burkholderia thailandensis]MDW9237415.1 hypothetical protein [Burkholderia thailandensis]MDW9251070.1 hypothetical protein [Burkholderia thailandensis]